jgi:hypothetical protein
MKVLEIDRCPLHSRDDEPGVRRAHTVFVKVSGVYGKPPQIDPFFRHRERW